VKPQHKNGQRLKLMLPALTNAQKISACARCTHAIKTVQQIGEDLVVVDDGAAGRNLNNDPTV
jgi:formate dehydrogenase assembly factor FdhD